MRKCRGFVTLAEVERRLAPNLSRAARDRFALMSAEVPMLLSLGNDGRDQMTDALKRAIRGGRLTQRQLRQLIASEAKQIGLSYDDALARAFANTLPRNAVGSDLRLLVRLLDEPPARKAV